MEPIQIDPAPFRTVPAMRPGTAKNMPEKRASSEGELAHDRRNMQIFWTRSCARAENAGSRSNALDFDHV